MDGGLGIAEKQESLDRYKRWFIPKGRIIRSKDNWEVINTVERLDREYSVVYISSPGARLVVDAGWSRCSLRTRLFVYFFFITNASVVAFEMVTWKV